MKKVLAVLLSALMLLSAMSIGVVAAEEKVPIVILQGYSGPDLAYADADGNPIVENGEVKLAWPLDFGNLGNDIMTLLADVTLNDADIVAGIVEKVREYLAPIAMNPDGTSVNTLVPYPSGAAATRASTLIENDMEEYISEAVVAEMAMAEVGAENVFSFTFDWRKSQVDYAAALDEYIQEVKALTGSSKVDIYGLSHGGQYGTTYLYYYGYKGDVRRAMFGNPATLGTTFCGSLFTGEKINVNLNDVIEYIEHGFEYEKDWEWLLDIVTFEDILVDAANAVITDPELWQGIISIPSLWDFVPYNYFEEALEYTGLNLEDNQKTYSDTVKYHNDISNGGLNLANAISDLRVAGTRIGYVVGTGYASINGKYNSDVVIDTYLSSGNATCALFGETLPEGYEKAGTVCANPNHYHISPNFDIDASTGVSPDSTWYVSGQGHGMIMHDDYTVNLVHDFLWGDVENVFSTKTYPQFNYSSNPNEIVYAKFNNTSAGYHTTKDTALELTNISAKSNIQILYIKAEGADIDFDYSIGMTVKQNETVTIKIKDGNYDDQTVPFAVNVTYRVRNTQSTVSTKIFNFTPLSNAQAIKYKYLLDDGVELPTVDEIPNSNPSGDVVAGGGADSGSGDSGTGDGGAGAVGGGDTLGGGTISGDANNGGATSGTGENVNGDIPNTSRVVKTSVAMLATAALVGAGVVGVSVVIKRKRDEE